MKKFDKIFKKVIFLFGILIVIKSYAAITSDNDGSVFISNAEFDALKSTFQGQLDNYFQNIDSKIDNAIASYLSGIKVTTEETGTLDLYRWMKNFSADEIYYNWKATDALFNEKNYIMAYWSICGNLFFTAARYHPADIIDTYTGTYTYKTGKESNLVARYVKNGSKSYLTTFEKDLSTQDTSTIIFYYDGFYFGGAFTSVKVSIEKDFPTDATTDTSAYSGTNVILMAHGTSKTSSGSEGTKYAYGMGFPGTQTWAYGYYTIAEKQYTPKYLTATKTRNSNTKGYNYCAKFPIQTTTSLAYTGAGLTKSQILTYRAASDVSSEEDLWTYNIMAGQAYTRRIHTLTGPPPKHWTVSNDFSIEKDRYYIPKVEVVDYSNVYDNWVRENYGVDNSLTGPAPLYKSSKAGALEFQVMPSVEGKFYITTNPELNIYNSSLYTSTNLVSFKAALSESGLNTASSALNYKSSAKTYFLLETEAGKNYFIFFVPTTTNDVYIVPEQNYLFKNSK